MTCAPVGSRLVRYWSLQSNLGVRHRTDSINPTDNEEKDQPKPPEIPYLRYNTPHKYCFLPCRVTAVLFSIPILIMILLSCARMVKVTLFMLLPVMNSKTPPAPPAPPPSQQQQEQPHSARVAPERKFQRAAFSYPAATAEQKVALQLKSSSWQPTEPASKGKG